MPYKAKIYTKQKRNVGTMQNFLILNLVLF